MPREYVRVFSFDYISTMNRHGWRSKGREDGLPSIYIPCALSTLIPSEGHYRFRCREVSRTISNGTQIIFLDLFEEVTQTRRVIEKGSLSSEKEVRRILSQSSGLIGASSRKKKRKKNRAA